MCRPIPSTHVVAECADHQCAVPAKAAQNLPALQLPEFDLDCMLSLNFDAPSWLLNDLADDQALSPSGSCQ